MAHAKVIETEIIIHATPKQVWEVLTDFESYPSWNPFIKSLTGDVEVGNTIAINVNGMKFKPTILVCEHCVELRWIGRLLFKGLFDGEHIFKLVDNQDGTVTFMQSKYFNGLLVRPFSKKLDNETAPGFRAMNAKLKSIVEQRNLS